MKYERIETGKFIERPNRFIAYVEIAGKQERWQKQRMKLSIV